MTTTDPTTTETTEEREAALKAAHETVFGNLPEGTHGALMLDLPNGAKGCVVLDDGSLAFIMAMLSQGAVMVDANASPAEVEAAIRAKVGVGAPPVTPPVAPSAGVPEARIDRGSLGLYL